MVVRMRSRSLPTGEDPPPRRGPCDWRRRLCRVRLSQLLQLLRLAAPPTQAGSGSPRSYVSVSDVFWQEGGGNQRRKREGEKAADGSHGGESEEGNWTDRKLGFGRTKAPPPQARGSQVPPDSDAWVGRGQRGHRTQCWVCISEPERAWGWEGWRVEHLEGTWREEPREKEK